MRLENGFTELGVLCSGTGEWYPINYTCQGNCLRSYFRNILAIQNTVYCTCAFTLCVLLKTYYSLVTQSDEQRAI